MKEYILKLFENTKDGLLTFRYSPPLDEPYTETYKMAWTRQDAENTVKHFEALVSALTRIGKVQEPSLLTDKELQVYNTYILPFEPFEVDESVISELYSRREGDTLSEDENELLERHCDWFVSNSRKRLPYNNCCPSRLIDHARYYVTLISQNAPESALKAELRSLADAMVIYHHSEKKLEYNLLRFILAQSSTYKKALEEIKKGKKTTHWMWFIFPQLRGLGKSDKAYTYGIADLYEAKAYLSHCLLGSRLIEISTELLKLKEPDPIKIFGDIDAMKLRSSMTLFAFLSDNDSVFHKVLDKFFAGQTDPRTLEILNKKEK